MDFQFKLALKIIDVDIFSEYFFPFVATKNLGSIGSAGLTFIGHKHMDKQA